MLAKWTLFVSFFAIMLVLAFPGQAMAQVDLGGASRITFSGSGTVSESPMVTTIAGISRFTEGGLEIGGDIWAFFSESGVSGTGFGRVSQNFIGESLTVPFVTGGVGAPFSGGGFLYDAGAGIKRFLDERTSFDLMASWQGYLSTGRGGGGSGSLSVRFGLSIYLGN